MPKTKIVAVKSTKKKLSPAERSQIAKDRWEKRRKTATPEIVVDWNGVSPAVSVVLETPAISTTPYDAMLDAAAENAPSGVDRVEIQTEQGSVLASKDIPHVDSDGKPFFFPPVAPPAEIPAPQLTPVRAPKPKRYTGPKEFSVALKAAESRLAKAIVERAELVARLAGLQAEIPSLLGIIQALKGSGNYAPPVPYDFSGSVPNAAAFQSPIPQYPNPLAAIQAAQPAPPVSRAMGNAVQFGPDVVGALEGPDDDDPDRFITGPNAGGNWIGG